MAVHDGSSQKHGFRIRLLTILVEEVASKARDMGGSIFELLVRKRKQKTALDQEELHDAKSSQV